MTAENRFMPCADFIENAFERRFQGLLRSAQRDRTWHVVAAVPGSGKSYGIADLVASSGAAKHPDGRTQLPVLAVCAPKGKASPGALGIALTMAFGIVPKMTGDARRAWLVGELVRAAAELLIIDDAHDLTLDHLAYLKELTDNLAAPPYQRRLGLCLVSASAQGVIPLQETFRARRELIWRQFRRRLDAGRPYCLVLGHTEDEVREICAGYEEVYREQFPRLRLVRWARSMYGWLTHPVLDPERSGRVTMSHLANLVRLGLGRAAAAGLDDVTGDLLHEVASLMTLRVEEVTLVDGEPDVACRPARVG
ncbi:MAG TPA: ATP-binding protein [Chloroflexota bacterium]|nr:ATP-binding protein [Chloroflexota bacterium]